MHLVFDLDGVICDFDQGFYDLWKTYYPDIPCVTPEEKSSFYWYDVLPKEVDHIIRKVCEIPEFYEVMPPVKGAIEYLNRLVEEGKDFRICSSPPDINYVGLKGLQIQVKGKYWWLQKHLGNEISKKLIIARDKTWVTGEYLIDDKPHVKGLLRPQWKQLLFDRPYNKNINLTRVTWDTLDSVIRTLHSTRRI